MKPVLASTHVIVCEKTSRWAVAIRRALGKQEGQVKETRSLPGCARELAARPASVVAVEVSTANLQAVIDTLADWSRRFPDCRMIALVDPQATGAAFLLREAGAIAVISSARELADVMPLVHRHFANAPAARLPLEQAAWASLPWSNWASNKLE